MYNFPIAFMASPFGTSFDARLEMATRLGVNGLQLVVPEGGKAPRVSAEQIAEVNDKLKSHGLVASALCGDIGAYTDPELNKVRVDEFKRMLDLSLELGTNIVTTHIGCVPDDKSNPTYAVMQDACGRIGEYAASIGAKFAVETGPEMSGVLKEFLDSLHTAGSGVNLDPANLTMCICDNAVDAVYNLKDYIVHTHAKDGVNLEKKTATTPYRFKEMPLGQGDVCFPKYLRALEDIGYRGFLAIEREIHNPEEDIALAVGFLRGTIGAL